MFTPSKATTSLFTFRNNSIIMIVEQKIFLITGILQVFIQIGKLDSKRIQRIELSVK